MKYMIIKFINLLALLASIGWMVSKWPDPEPVVSSLVLLAVFIGMEVKDYLKEVKTTSTIQQASIPKPFDPAVYDRRRAVYDKVKEVINKINSDGDATNDQIYMLYDQMEESHFLFGEEVIIYIRSLIDNTIMLKRTNRKISANRTSDEEFQKISDKNVEILDFFSNQHNKIIIIFRPYLHVEGEKR